MDEDETRSGVGRRALLRRAALLAAASPLLAVAATSGALADEKMSQKDAEYRTTPKNGQSCSACQYFLAPASCKLVKGTISPQGWCDFWGSKTP